MGLSSSLLVLALLVALVPMSVLRFRPPTVQRDLEKVFVMAVATTVVGTIALRVTHNIGFFGLAHLAYLLAVISLPVLTVGWWLLARLRGDQRRWQSLLSGLGILAAVAGFYGTHIEPNWLRVDRAEVIAAVPGPLRIGVIADLQTPNVGDHERNVVATVIAERPDLVVIPGDLFQGPPDVIAASRSDFVGLLRELVNNVGVVAVTSGDSDHTFPLREMVEESGALFIDDTIRELDVNGVMVRLAGVRVLANGPARNDTLAAIAEPTDAFSLLVAHRPDAVFDLPADADIDLVIAGHTHGGQVSIPFFGPPVTFSDVPRDAAAGGLSIVDNVPLYVSSGVGLERNQAPQVRFGVRPSVGIIDVSAGDNG